MDKIETVNPPIPTPTPTPAPNMKPKNNFLLVLFCALVLFFVGLGGYFIGQQTTIKSYNKYIQARSTPVPVQVASSNAKCEKYGTWEKSEYLTSYTVKTGDTLLSIAKSQLGSTARINEIINLNNDRYADLSVSKPFLENGWILYMPPEGIPESNGNIFKVSGEITKMEGDGQWVIEGPGMASGHQVTSETKLMKDSPFVVGDCVHVLKEGLSQRAFTVELQ